MHVHDELLVLAQRFAAQQQPAAALKCLVAVLGSGPLPAVQARAGLLQARLLLEHSTNLGDARSILNTLLLRVKEPAAFASERCECWSLLADIELHSGDAESAQKMCQSGILCAEKHRDSATGTAWLLHFGCLLARISAFHPTAGASAQSVLTKLAAASSQLGVLRLRTATLHARMAAGDAAGVREELASASDMHSAARHADGAPPCSFETEVHLQALLTCGMALLHCGMVGRAASLGDGASPPAGAGEHGVSGDLEATLRAAQSHLETLKGRDLTLQWMSYGSQAALLRFLQAALCLAHHCGKADKAGVTAAAYAGRGMAALTESDASSPAEVTLRHALRVLLTVVAFQSQITAFGGRATEDRLQAAQQALAELQGAAHTVPAGLGMGQRAALAGLTHFCSALYALSLEDGRAALSHLGHAADALQSGGDRSSSRHAALLLLTLSTKRALLAASGAATPAGLVVQLQELERSQSEAAQAAENSPIASAALLLHCAALRYEGGGSGKLVKGDARFGQVLPAARAAFTLCQQHPGHAQLVCIALRVFGEALVADGDLGAGATAMQTAYKTAKDTQDARSRQHAMDRLGQCCLSEDASKLQMVAKRAHEYKESIAAHAASGAHAQLLAWRA